MVLCVTEQWKPWRRILLTAAGRRGLCPGTTNPLVNKLSMTSQGVQKLTIYGVVGGVVPNRRGTGPRTTIGKNL
jgi:hypothetical protein